MAAVYVVTSEVGLKSRLHLHGAFSAREKADHFIEVVGLSPSLDNAKVKEMIIDELDGLEWAELHEVYINLRTGRVETPEPCRSLVKRGQPFEVVGPWEGGGNPPHLWLTVKSPRSEEHARAVAVEKRQEWLRARAAAGHAGGDGAASASTAPA